MYARSTTLHAQSGSIDAGIANFRDETLPALQGIEGFVGASLIVDRDSGLCIATTNWSSADARQASAERVVPIRDRASAALGATSAEVGEWEIAGMHREHYSEPGACVRTTWLRTDPSQLERLVDAWRMRVLSALDGMAGFCSASLMLDRASGRAVGTATFASRETLEASRKQTEIVRGEATKQAGAEVMNVQEFELAVAHLHEPAMA